MDAQPHPAGEESARPQTSTPLSKSSVLERSRLLLQQRNQLEQAIKARLEQRLALASARPPSPSREGDSENASAAANAHALKHPNLKRAKPGGQPRKKIGTGSLKRFEATRIAEQLEESVGPRASMPTSSDAPERDVAEPAPLVQPPECQPEPEALPQIPSQSEAQPPHVAPQEPVGKAEFKLQDSQEPEEPDTPPREQVTAASAASPSASAVAVVVSSSDASVAEAAASSVPQPEQRQKREEQPQNKTPIAQAPGEGASKGEAPGPPPPRPSRPLAVTPPPRLPKAATLTLLRSESARGVAARSPAHMMATLSRRSEVQGGNGADPLLQIEGESRFAVERALYAEHVQKLSKGAQKQAAMYAAFSAHLRAMQQSEEAVYCALNEAACATTGVHQAQAQGAQAEASVPPLASEGLLRSLSAHMQAVAKAQLASMERLRADVSLPALVCEDMTSQETGRMLDEARHLEAEAAHWLEVMTRAKEEVAKEEAAAAAAAGVSGALTVAAGGPSASGASVSAGTDGDDDALDLPASAVERRRTEWLEASARFRAALYDYEQGLPELTRALAGKWKERLAVFRGAATMFVQLKREWLRTCSESLDRMQSALEALNVEDELRAIVEPSQQLREFEHFRVAGPSPMTLPASSLKAISGCDTPQPMVVPVVPASCSGSAGGPVCGAASATLTMKRRTSEPDTRAAGAAALVAAKLPAAKSPGHGHATATDDAGCGVRASSNGPSEFLFVEKLWGPEGQRAIHSRAEQGKLRLKRLQVLLGEWSGLLRAKGEHAAKSAALFRAAALGDDELAAEARSSGADAKDSAVGPSERACWEALEDTAQGHARHLASAASRLAAKALEMRRHKQLHKRNLANLVEKRAALDKQFAQARDAASRARERRAAKEGELMAAKSELAARRVYSATPSQLELDKLTLRVRKAHADFLSADHAAAQATRLQSSVQLQVDLASAHILATTQQQELERETHYHRAAQHATRVLDQLCGDLMQADADAASFAASVDLERDIKNSTLPAMHARVGAGLSKLKALCAFVDAAADADEHHAKLARALQKQQHQTPLREQTGLESSMTEFVELVEEAVGALRGVVAAQLRERRKEMKDRFKAIVAKHQALDKRVASAIAAAESAASAGKKSEDHAAEAADKFARAQKSDEAKKNAKKLDKLRDEAEAAREAARVAGERTAEARAALAQAERLREEEGVKLAAALRQVENDRCDLMRWAINAAMSHRRTYCKKWRSLAALATAKHQQLEHGVASEVMAFADAQATPLCPPSSVLQHESLLRFFVLSRHAERAVDEGAPTPLQLVRRCVDWLRSHPDAVKTQGIFRVSVARGDVDAHRASLQFADPHAVAALLKAALRDLPEPVVPTEHYRDFLAVAHQSTAPLQIAQLQRVFAGADGKPMLPEELRELLLFLRDVAEQSEENKMDVHNLAVVFAPNLVGMQAGKAETLTPAVFAELRDANRSCELLLEHCRLVFMPTN